MAAERTFTVYGTSNVEGPIRPLATGAMFPAGIDVLLLDMDDDDVRITLTLRNIEGRPVLVGVAVGPISSHPFVGHELSATVVHDLPVKKLTEMAVRAVAVQAAETLGQHMHRDPATEGVRALRSRRRRGLSDDELREVAQVVAEHPGNGTAAVYDQLAAPAYYSYRTAARWVAEAKDRFPELFKEGK